MADVFKDPPTAAYLRPMNLNVMVVKAIWDNPLSYVGFKTSSDAKRLVQAQHQHRLFYDPINYESHQQNIGQQVLSHRQLHSSSRMQSLL